MKRGQAPPHGEAFPARRLVGMTLAFVPVSFLGILS
jgi:hypothetical protein